MSKEVRVGSLAEVNNLVYGDEYQDSVDLVVTITGVDTIGNAPGMLSQLRDMVDSNQWCIRDKEWINKVVEASALLSKISVCLEQLGDDIQGGIHLQSNVQCLRGFHDAIQHLIEGPLPWGIRDVFRRLRTLLDRRFSTSDPVFQPVDLQQQAHQMVVQLIGTALVNPAFRDGTRANHLSFEEETTRLLNMLSKETPPLSDLQKTVFLDELLRNSCSALDMVKPRKEHVVSPPLYIEIIINKEMNTFTVRDTGMGMTRSDLTDKLTNAARSKINDFMKSVDDGVTMTNQFSIGFFSTYFVANKVSVTTKHDNDEQYTWEARSNSSCTISPDNDGKSLGRGTKITLYLKDDQEPPLLELYLQ